MSAHISYFMRTSHGWGRCLSLDSDAEAMGYAQHLSDRDRLGVAVYAIPPGEPFRRWPLIVQDGGARLVGEVSR